MIPVYNFPIHTRGDTFKAREITFNMDLTGCSIIIQFKKNIQLKTPDFEFKTSDNTITVLDAVLGKVRLEKKIIDVKEGIYNYDVQITFPAGEIRTFFKGNITIKEDITHDRNS